MRQQGLAPGGNQPLNVYLSHHSENRNCKVAEHVPTKPDFKVRIAKMVEMEAAERKAQKEREREEARREAEAAEAAERAAAEAQGLKGDVLGGDESLCLGDDDGDGAADQEAEAEEKDKAE